MSTNLVFSTVVAYLAKDLNMQFPSGFDFNAMLTKVGEDAGVCVKFEKSASGKCFKLQGLWCAVGQAYSLIKAAVKMHGIGASDDGNTVVPPHTGHKDRKPGNKSSKQKSTRFREKETKSDLVPSSGDNGGGEVRDNGGETHDKQDLIMNISYKSCEQLTVTDQLTEATTQRNKHKKSTSKLSANIMKQCVQNTILDTVEDGTSQQPKAATKRHKLYKNTPLNLSHINHKYSFLSKYKTQSYPSLCSTVRKRRALMTTSSGLPQSVVEDEHGSSLAVSEQVQSEFSCSYCKFSTSSRSTVTDHIQREHKSNPVSCDLCGKIFRNQSYMQRHRPSHIGPQHCCDVCGKMFKIKKAMINHRKTHEEGYTRPVFPCKLCSKTFCSKYIANCHERSFHMGQKKSYLCSYCGKKFTTKHSLQEHINAHSGIKPHICEICGKGFSYDSALRDHKFTHGDVKQFKCDLCDKSFCQRSGLKMHMRIHKDTKQFQCQECGREFTQKQALQRHERVHKGVKPFMCKLCTRSFSDASIIRRHLTLVHKLHKDAKTWREDILCSVQPDLKYHVSNVGLREPDPEPTKSHMNTSEAKTTLLTRSPTKLNSNRGRRSTKLSRKEVVDQDTHLPVHFQPVFSVSEPLHRESLTERREFSSVPVSHCSDLLSISAETHSHVSLNHDQTVFHASDCLPQADDSTDLGSHDLESSLPSVTPAYSCSYDIHTEIHLSSSNTDRISSNLREDHDVPSLCTNPSANTTVHSSFSHEPFAQSNISGEQQGQSCHIFRPQLVVRTQSPTIATGSKTIKDSPAGIVAQRPWPSLYYSHLADQFGLNLSNYIHSAHRAHIGVGQGASSLGQEHSSASFPRILCQTHLQVGQPSSLPHRPQIQGQINTDPPQSHNTEATQNMQNGQDGMILTSSVVESSQCGLKLEEGVGLQHVTTFLPSTGVHQECQNKAKNSSQV